MSRMYGCKYCDERRPATDFEYVEKGDTMISRRCYTCRMATANGHKSWEGPLHVRVLPDVGVMLQHESDETSRGTGPCVRCETAIRYVGDGVWIDSEQNVYCPVGVRRNRKDSDGEEPQA
jgi:hypothetical protein